MRKVLIPNEVILSEMARQLDEGRDVIMTPKGVSMLPFIRGEKDSVLLRKTSPLYVGDIVLVNFNGTFLMHRIISINGTRITLMGDGHLQGTETGRISDVLGTVIEIIRPNGRHVKPKKGRIWVRLLPVRKYLLKIYRKWNKLFANN